MLLRLRNVTGESPDPVPPPPAYDGGLLRDFFSGVKHPFYKKIYIFVSINVGTYGDIIFTSMCVYVNILTLSSIIVSSSEKSVEPSS